MNIKYIYSTNVCWLFSHTRSRDYVVHVYFYVDKNPKPYKYWGSAKPPIQEIARKQNFCAQYERRFNCYFPTYLFLVRLQAVPLSTISMRPGIMKHCHKVVHGAPWLFRVIWFDNVLLGVILFCGNWSNCLVQTRCNSLKQHIFC